jgi:hypothetical protein
MIHFIVLLVAFGWAIMTAIPKAAELRSQGERKNGPAKARQGGKQAPTSSPRVRRTVSAPRVLSSADYKEMDEWFSEGSKPEDYK